MKDLNDYVNGNTLAPSDFNEIPSEIQNAIIDSGQALSSGDLTQLSKAVSANVANKAAAVLLTPVNNKLYFIGGTDGGLFKGITGAAPGTYSDNGGSYCGTQFIPTGGDGSAAWARVYDGAVSVRWFGAVGDGVTDDTNAIQQAINSLSSTGHIIFPDLGGSIYVLYSKPTGSGSGYVFIYEGSAKLSNNSYYPDGTNIFRYNSQGSETSYASVLVIGDDLDQEAIAGSKVNALKSNMVMPGGHKGGRHSMYGLLQFQGASDAAGVDRNYVGVQGQTIISSDDGGTGTTAGTGKGAFFGISSITNAISGSTNLLNVSGAEINVKMDAGSSCWLKTGVQAVDKSTVSGTIDAGYLVGASSASSGWGYGVLLATTNGGAPVAVTGTLIGSSGAYTVTNGIDFAGVLFSSNIFNATNFKVVANGSMEIGSLSSPQSTIIDFHSSGNNIDYDSRIIATGGSGSSGTGALTFQSGISVFNNLLRATGLPTYADEAAAVTGGLSTGDIYKTVTGELRIKL